MQYKAIDIRCPTCGALAKFEEPFEFLPFQNTSAHETRPWHRWGGWVVVERFPSQFNWQAPSTSHQYLRGGGCREQGGYPVLTYGLVRCGYCHANSKHKLQWPNDAYWQWEIRGEVLWAWDINHAKVILDYVREAVRPPNRPHSLRYVPTHFLTAKVRDLVVRKMEKSLHKPHPI